MGRSRIVLFAFWGGGIGEACTHGTGLLSVYLIPLDSTLYRYPLVSTVVPSWTYNSVDPVVAFNFIPNQTPFDQIRLVGTISPCNLPATHSEGAPPENLVVK